MIEELPHYWKYKSNHYKYSFIIMKNNSIGFTREEAEQIAPQIIKDSRLCQKLNKHKYKKIKLDNKEVYIMIDVAGKAKKPKIRNKNYDLPSNPYEIQGFRENELW